MYKHTLNNETECVLGTLYPPGTVEMCKIPICSTVCKSMTLRMRSSENQEYTIQVDDTGILQRQTFCDEFEYIDILVENPSLSLYNLNSETLHESIFLLSSLCYNGTISSDRIRRYDPSSFAILLVLIDFLGFPKDAYEYVSDIMRGIGKKYMPISHHIGLPHACARDSVQGTTPVRTINGAPSSIFLHDLDGEFIVCRQEKRKVFFTDSNVIAPLLELIQGSITHSLWLSRKYDVDVLAKSILNNKMNPYILSSIGIDQVAILNVASKYHYFLCVLSPEHYRVMPVELFIYLCRLDKSILTARIVSTVLGANRDYISPLVVSCVTGEMSIRERECLAKYILRAKLGNDYAAALYEGTNPIPIEGKDISMFIDTRFPIHRYIQFCDASHIRVLLLTYEKHGAFIYDELITRYL